MTLTDTLPDPKTVTDSDTAAKLLNVSPEYVALLCRQKKLIGTRVAGRWWIDKKTLAEYQKFQAFAGKRGLKLRKAK